MIHEPKFQDDVTGQNASVRSLSPKSMAVNQASPRALSLALLLSLFQSASAQTCTGQLYTDLQNNVTDAIPSVPTELQVQFALYSLLDIDELAGTHSILLWLRHTWNDPRLQWDPNDYCNISSSVVPRSAWHPELQIYNLAHPMPSHDELPQGSVGSSGDVFWSAPMTVRVQCSASAQGDRPGGRTGNQTLRDLIGSPYPTSLSMDTFPFVVQNCELELASWVHDSSRLNLTLASPSTDPVDGFFVESREWKVLRARGELRQLTYSIDADPYPTVFLYLIYQRLSGFFIRLLLIPVALAVLLSNMAFTMEAVSERITHNMTSLLAVLACVFLAYRQIPPSGSPTLMSFFFSLSFIHTIIPSVISGSQLLVWRYLHENDGKSKKADSFLRHWVRVSDATGAIINVLSYLSVQIVVFSSSTVSYSRITIAACVYAFIPLALWVVVTHTLALYSRDRYARKIQRVYDSEEGVGSEY